MTESLEDRALIKKMENHGTLYLVGTPIGNLDDMVPRAIEVLQSVDCIAAEDTRRAGQLLQHFSINTPTLAYHDHNELQAAAMLVQKLLAGQSVALVSDAGMPLISDPGYSLVHLAREHQLEVIAVPGPCAGILALCASGLPTDRFSFVGFPPAKTTARKRWYEELADRGETLVAYESPHRLIASLVDAVEALGGNRQVAIARELTKKFESWYVGSLSEVIPRLGSELHAQKGEFVLVFKGSPPKDKEQAEVNRLMKLLIPELGLKRSASLVAQILEVKKNLCYQVGLQIKEEGGQGCAPE